VAFNVQTEAPPLIEDASGALRVGNSRVPVGNGRSRVPGRCNARDDRAAILYVSTSRRLRRPCLLFTYPKEVEEYLARREQRAEEVQQRIESQQHQWKHHK